MTNNEDERRAQLDELALKLAQAYEDNPHFTINLAASHIGDCTVQDVAEVLDEYQVLPDGVVHLGPGQGGGWAPSVEPEFEPLHAGWRWPDGSLRNDVFDISDPDHRSQMGLEMDQETADRLAGK